MMFKPIFFAPQDQESFAELRVVAGNSRDQESRQVSITFLERRLKETEALLRKADVRALEAEAWAASLMADTDKDKSFTETTESDPQGMPPVGHALDLRHSPSHQLPHLAVAVPTNPDSAPNIQNVPLHNPPCQVCLGGSGLSDPQRSHLDKSIQLAVVAPHLHVDLRVASAGYTGGVGCLVYFCIPQGKGLGSDGHTCAIFGKPPHAAP